jgi:hypothetical protein
MWLQLSSTNCAASDTHSAWLWPHAAAWPPNKLPSQYCCKLLKPWLNKLATAATPGRAARLLAAAAAAALMLPPELLLVLQ